MKRNEKEKWRSKAHSSDGIEEDHKKFCKSRKKFKKIMDEKCGLMLGTTQTLLLYQKVLETFQIQVY